MKAPSSAASHLFASTYAESRSMFLDAAQATDALIWSLPHPLGAQRPERPCVDLAWLGPTDAQRVIVHHSGVHGVEGYCGAAVQTGLLRSGLFGRGGKVASLFIHAVNPLGYLDDRRVTEGNIDLNRNFVDFSQPLPRNPLYDSLHPLLFKKFSKDGPAAWEAARSQLTELHEEDAMDHAISAGQYDHDNGLHYGGTEPTWSRLMLENIFRKHLSSREHVTVLDYHTGAGPYCHAELIVCNTSAHGRDQAKRAYPGATVPGEDSVITPLHGTLARGLERVVPEGFTYLSVEYGTRDHNDVLAATLNENWLYASGDADFAERKQIKEQFRDAYYPEETRWKDAVWQQGLEINELVIKHAGA